MSSYVRETKFEMTFDGDQLRAILAPLKLVDALKINMAVGSRDIPGRADDLVVVFQEALPNYVKEFSGLRAADGTPVTIQEVVQATYFTPVIRAIGMALIEAARVPDPKQPAAPSNGALAGTVPSTETPSMSVG